MVIEVDGSSHDNKYEQDLIRQNNLEEMGLKFLRFTDKEVKRDMNNVLRIIQGWIEENSGSMGDHNPPNPSFDKLRTGFSKGELHPQHN